MIIDTSAVIAILRQEPEAASFTQILASHRGPKRISAGNYIEVGAVIDAARDPVAGHRVDELLQEAGIVIEPVSEEQAKAARAAYRDFGRGSGHAAQLNFGDCFAYALAKHYREPLLFKGTDFSATDLQTVEQES